MNMKKTIGICATLLAALLCAVPQSAQAAGKIRSVDVYDPSGLHTFPNHDGHDTPLTVGDTVYIRFRLANLVWGASETDPTYENPWSFVYPTTGNETLDQLMQIAANKPRLGLWVSGGLREAECVNFPMGVASDWLTDTGAVQGKHYTDLIFKYTVQAGDLALPLQLANASGDGPSTGSEGYYLKCNGQEVLWKIQATNLTGTVTADFMFGDGNLPDDPDFTGDNTVSWLGVSGYENRDLDLYKAGAYIQAIDFDKTYFNESAGIWRSVAQGSTTPDPGTPMVEIAGGAAQAMDLYLWAADKDVAEIVTGGKVSEVSEYVFHDGVTRKVGKLRIVTDDENVPFSIKALGAVGAQTEVFLSATPTNILNASGNLITNFITRTIVVGDPLPPSISVTVNGKASETVTANADHRTAQVAVNVTLSEAYTADNIDIPIKVTLRSNTLGLDPTNYVGLSESSLNDNTAWDTVLHVEKGKLTAEGSLGSSLWMYANRGSVDTEVGLLFEVNTNDANWVASPAYGFFTGKFTGATVVINRSTPEITAELTAVSAEANAPQEIRVNVADSYGELHEPCKYTVYWSNSGNDAPAYYTKIANVAATASGDLIFSVKYSQKGDFESLYYVENQDGKVSTKHTAYVHVNAAKVVDTTLVDRRGKFAENEFEDQPVVTLSFGDEGFRMPDDSDWGYVFFVPKSANASNLVSCADMDGGSLVDTCDWKWGYPVYRGETEVGPIEMTLRDGDSKGLKMEYDIIVRSDPDFDAGMLVTSWSSKGFSFSVTNVAPTVSTVKMGNETLYESGGHMGTVSLGVKKAFYAETDEPSDIDFYADKPDYTNQTTVFQTHWDIKLGSSTLFSTNICGPSTTPFDYTFRQAGAYTVEVSMRDKDSIDRTRYPERFGQKFTFTVNVDAKPAVSLSPHFGSAAFTENDGGTGENCLSRIDVNLSTLPTEQIAVQLSIERAGPDNGNYPLPELSTTVLTFGGESANTTNAWFTLRNLDGTDRTLDPGFVIHAAVTNETRNSDNVPWKDVYRDMTLPITIQNLAPEVTRPSSNTVERAINEPFTINYTFKDFGSYDMFNNGIKGETLYWTITGESSTNYVVTPPPNQNTYRGEFTTKFTSAGTKTVQLQVVDKDGGESEVATWYYVVKAAKQLIVNPCGPGSSGGGNFAIKWTGAPNAGVGRVWANGTIKPFEDFSHMYTYAPSVASAYAYAHGYRAGDTDNGSLTPGTDYAVTDRGKYPATGNYYTADTELDSFFYAWLLTTGGGAAGSNTSLLTLAPAYGRDSNAKQRVDLPEEEQDATYYPDTVLDAIFSKEYLPTDNLGDINLDMVPDYYAVMPIWDGGKRLFEVAGGAAEAGGDIEFNGLKYNDDGDYLPSRSFEGGMPSSVSGWTTLSAPFTAYWEIRGFHEGLNHRTGHDGMNKFVRGTWVSTPHFSEAETNAVAYWNGVQTWADFKANNSTDDAGYADAYKDWTNAFWTAIMKSNSWIPENRTDPTMYDTDDDGFPDGYEYFFWYKAAVGNMVDGKWVQMTGSRFTLNNITMGVEISPAEIRDAFNPTVKARGEEADIRQRDTDNDGLTDFEELAMGTNPVHWDSDGDGMNDLWEVMRGMNPLKQPTDPERNQDGDFMAAHTTDETYGILTMTNGLVFALSQNGANIATFNKELFDGGTNVPAAAVFGVDEGAANVSNVMAIAVFRYGDDSSTCVPKALGNRKTLVKPLDLAQVNMGDMVIAKFEINKPLMLIHNQVYNQFGFDPRTGWYKNSAGAVAARWAVGQPVTKGDSGMSVNTVAYNCTDEYRVLKYRYETGLRKVSDDKGKSLADVFSGGTTNPNKPFTEANFLVYDAIGEFPTYSSDNHGADTDEDGIPDGWELYVGANPNVRTDAPVDDDGDGLSLVNEYAGTDSCNAYESAANAGGTATIYQNHPGNNKGWFNKFFPTDPNNGDTDGDGLSDGGEGGTWRATFRLWQTEIQEVKLVGERASIAHDFTFIYGNPSDDGGLCIRGGGLNPCAIDTDFDLLPDAWEHDFAGVVFKDGHPWQEGDTQYGTTVGGLLSGVIEIINRNDNVTSNATPNAYITAGMDGTFGPASGEGDAVSRPDVVDSFTGTQRNLDFDNDGLQNFQEYLVQTLRHLRYDDTETPLMGSYLPDGVAGTRRYVGFLPMQVWDGAEFYKTARAAGFSGLSAYQGTGFRYDELGYFTRPPMAWDPMSLRESPCENYDENGYRILMRPNGLSWQASDIRWSDAVGTRAGTFLCTDPRLWDSDADGMDDYYELFHGLNPLLGGEDVIANAYYCEAKDGKQFSARCNAWTGWEEKDLEYDAMKYPWAMGTAEADADGDGLRNTDEALLVNMPNPKNYHTDPTPLWMTDSSSKISVTSQYYCRDPYMETPDLSNYFWFKTTDDSVPGAVENFMYSFEENEGYDTDHDWIPDEQEVTHAVTSSTDPLDATDPDRRQAMYFPGTNSVVASYSSNLHRRLGENYAMLRSFTAEAWVRPEDLTRAQTILTRVCDYPSSTLLHGKHQVRANFRLAMDDNGHIYGQYDSDDAVPSDNLRGFGTTTVTGIALEADKWTHVALSYDGSALVLYVDGREVNRANSTLSPANGLVVTLQSVTPSGANFGGDQNSSSSGYTKLPSALLVGADAAELGAITIGADSAWTNYCAHYQGWVDEVRVWDGARTAAQITEDYTKRYSLADVSSLREEVYRLWLEGGTHNSNDGRSDLPAELLLHYSFQQLPSEVNTNNLATMPSGFSEKVRDNVRWNGHPVDISCGWWSAVPIASTVYRNRAIVPWLRNTCSALPPMEGSAPDSVYWGELLAGVTFPSEVSVSKFVFPNAANPYPYWRYMAESFNRGWQLRMLCLIDADLEVVAQDVYNRFNFDNRTLFVGGSDLLPLGGAYAKRCPDFWDGNGASDAWTATLNDRDNDGLPDWWEYNVATAYIDDVSGMTATTMVDYKLPSGAVVNISARDAYLIDLARGMMPDGSYDTTFASQADSNGDGIPDWWQKLYGVYDYGADDDPDNDGLSNFYEWLISWGDEYGFGVASGFPLLNPLRVRTGRDQQVTDYFLRNDASAEYAGYYLGEILTDHDFMEDWWENTYKLGYASIGAYDPWDDKDEDGWSNFAECRNALWSGTFTADAISRYFDGEQMSLCYPAPALGVRVTYNGEQDVVGKKLVVRTHSGFQKRTDATFVVVGGNEDLQKNSKFLGGYYTGATTLRGFLDPGAVLPAETHFYLAWMVTGKTYRWEVPKYIVYERSGLPIPQLGKYSELMAHIQRYGKENVILLNSELSWEEFGTSRATDALGKLGVIDSIDGGTQVGTIDFTTGEYSLDMAKIAALKKNSLEGCVFKVEYQTRISRDWPQSFWLSAPKVGRVREGKNTVEAFIDLDGDEQYTPGEPLGVVQNVDVGWHRTTETLIELKDTIGVVPRFDVSSKSNDRTAVEGVSGGVVVGSGGNGDSEGASSGGDSGGLAKKVRIVRRSINGVDAPKRILMNKSFVLDDRAYIHEGDIISPARLDLDWVWLSKDAAALQIENIRTVEYGIEEVRSLPDGTSTNIQLATFLNHYNSSRAVPTAVRPVDGASVHSATPTFRWAMADETMTAFELQVRDADGVVVYDSGIQRLPGRTATYVDTAHYAFNPFLSVNDCVNTNGAPVFADGTNWQWRVAVFNSKYNTADESAWSQWTDFRTDTVNNGISTGYGACTAAVRYYGPGAVADPGLVVVEAFATADFSGQPLARTRLSSVNNLAFIDDVTTTNACFCGIDPGTVYLRAFIDRNNNGKWDRWEPWGYANRRDESVSVSDIFSPKGLSITGDHAANVPSATIYIEDTDLNRNRIMDVLEDDSLFVNSANAAEADSDNDGTGDDEEGEIGTDPSSWDSDGDGMPDGWEFNFAGTDPLLADADAAVNGDVMAYAEETWKLVSDAAGNAYLLNPANNDVNVGDDLPFSRLVARYDYPVFADNALKHYHGVGTNLVGGVATFRVAKVENVTAVLVHAQVYAAYGFDPDTANATAYAANKAVNTKAFTALDKYLLIRYFEALGFYSEEAVNKAGNGPGGWNDYSLRPYDPDNDRDGVPDGWELYTMFGTEGVTRTLNAAKISPFNYADARALAPAGDVTLLVKWNGGAPAYDPWSTDTNGNGILDVDEISNHLDELHGDADNDQLPNFAEYLIGVGFSQYFGGLSGISATNNYSLASLVTDYFRRIGNLYLGEMFTDHDFMEDLWEDQFDITKITRGLYDPWRDSDDDGWSNYAECRVGTDPTLGNSRGLNGTVRNYPVPTIHANVVMGPGEGMLSGRLVVQAFSKTSETTGLPDATWKVAFEDSSDSESDTGTSGSNTVDKASLKSSYIGVNPCRPYTMTLNPGSVKPGSVSFDFFDPDFATYIGGRLVYGSLNDSEWVNAFVEDRPTSATKGVLVETSLGDKAVEVGTIDYSTGLAVIDFTHLTNDWYILEDSTVDWTDPNATYKVMHLGSSYVRASWQSSAIGGNTRMSLHLGESDAPAESPTDLGHVREGNNTFVVFLDLEGGTEGQWDPGEPYGVAKDVDVGWSAAEFTVELTRTTPIMARFNLKEAIPAGEFDSANEKTDRGVVNNCRGYVPNEKSLYPGTNMPSNVSLTRVRVVRNWINRSSTSADVLLDRSFDLSVHPYLTEADLLANGVYDLDWGTLLPAWGAGAATLTNATYRVVIGDDDVGEYENFANNLPVLFANRYEARLWQTPTVPDPKLEQTVYSSRPTFRWSHTNSIDKAYPAFQLKIFKADKTTVVYDSGVQRAPARDSSGMYEWTAPVYAGMVTPNGYMFDTTNNYYWAVSMLDAKYTDFSIDEVKTPFRLSTSGNLYDGKGYGSIAVCVKYFGPLVGSLSANPTVAKNLIRVQAFTSPDFSGTPVAETYVTDISTIASESVIATNAVLTGVAQGGTYYVRAYIDTDSDRAKSDWESWGYACYVGDAAAKSVWAPKLITVTYDDMAPVTTVFIEDADTDNDEFPDAWEVNKNGNLAAQGTISGNTFFAAVNPDLKEWLSAYTKVAEALERSNAPNYPKVVRLMSSSPIAAAQLLSGENDVPPEETTSVRIKSFSLEDGLELEVVNTSTAGMSELITFSNEATVQLTLVCATTPDFADAKEVFVKNITIRANGTVVEPVTAEELAAARATVPEARFFKAILSK